MINYVLPVITIITSIPMMTPKLWHSHCMCLFRYMSNGPLAGYVKLRVAHAPGMPGTFSPPPRFSDPDMHHGTCVTHVPWCMPGSLTDVFLWSQWRGKRSRRSRRMRKRQFYVSGKRPIGPIQTAVCQSERLWRCRDMDTFSAMMVFVVAWYRFPQ